MSNALLFSPAPDMSTPAAVARVDSLAAALRAMAISDPMSADTVTLGTTLTLLKRAERWVAQEIEDRIDAETAQEAAA